ncbi:RNA polymerase sigma factor [Flavisphingomonas formosensis]|uniref:RNA polymerase sigma factor n=1 Tax=Flavisphingomonas formosensis TaxID=861534 RepID=UPI0012FA7A97|nr:sigma-70 family RNA polymerase sigma factor [Sphingomonas formosensis]
MGVGKATRPEESAAAAAGHGGLERLYRRYGRWLTRILRHQLGPHAQEADDLAQEAWLRVARYSEAEADRHPQALLKRIAVNLARDHMRRHVIRGGKAIDAREELDETPTALRQAADQEAIAQLKQIVLGLPPLYRDVFLLSRFTGMTYEDIARHFCISVKTVEWRMKRALEICAQHLRD